ncbi:MAG: diaminopimelate decarboxylase, partial [Clostridia bacterium]|nr:diaminopimelate decarboxylase [Clostridia bacterium]
MENKFYQKDNNGNLIIGGVLAQDIVAKFKTPLYVMDKNLIESNILSYVNALTNYKAGGIISYASKAFSCKEIYRIAKSLDIAVDVVSMGEIYTALSVGFNAQKMFFHGNNKTIEELNFAIENKVGTIVIDSLSEINDVNDIALKN